MILKRVCYFTCHLTENDQTTSFFSFQHSIHVCAYFITNFHKLCLSPFPHLSRPHLNQKRHVTAPRSGKAHILLTTLISSPKNMFRGCSASVCYVHQRQDAQDSEDGLHCLNRNKAKRVGEPGYQDTVLTGRQEVTITSSETSLKSARHAKQFWQQATLVKDPAETRAREQCRAGIQSTSGQPGPRCPLQTPPSQRESRTQGLPAAQAPSKQKKLPHGHLIQTN